MILLDGFRLVSVVAGVFVTYDGVRGLFPPPQRQLPPLVSAWVRILFGAFGVFAGLPTFLADRIATFAMNGPAWTLLLTVAWGCAATALVIKASIRTARPMLHVLGFSVLFLATLLAASFDRGV